MVGDTYTALLSGEQTGARFALIDMLIPAGGRPPSHRHDFAECFRVLEGSIEVVLRDDPPVRLEAEFGDRVESRTAPAPELSDEEQHARLRRAVERAPAYGMEVFPPS